MDVYIPALALFDHVNLLYGTVSEFCTAASCPDMTGPGGRTYAWYDDRGKKSRVAAPQYVDYVMTFTQKTVSDETVFPTKYGECHSIKFLLFPPLTYCLNGNPSFSQNVSFSDMFKCTLHRVT